MMMLFHDDPARWHAVRTRNALADGSFVYAVKTTKIYCRPTCKARLARRANVSFYPTASAASAAGFRACKRCKPDVEGSMPDERAVLQVFSFVAAPTAQQLSVSEMAKRTGLSKWHFHRVFKKTMGMTPHEYLRRSQAALSLHEGDGGTWPEQLDLDHGHGSTLHGASESSAGTANRTAALEPLFLDDLDDLNDLLSWPASPTEKTA